MLRALCCSLFIALNTSLAWAQSAPGGGAVIDSSAADALGWKLGVQTYSFNRFSFFEAIDKAASIGLKYAEAYPGQRISSDIDGSMGPDMTSEQCCWSRKSCNRPACG